MNIIGELKRERANQDLQHGGPAHDDTHTPQDWMESIFHQFTRFTEGQAFLGDAYPSSMSCRSRFVKIGALAIAALQSWGRKAGPEQSALMEVMVDPFQATVGELLDVLLQTNAAFMKVVPTDHAGTPLVGFITVAPGPALQPVLDLMDAISNGDDPATVRQAVLEALDRLEAAQGEVAPV